jgi:ribose 5-phosphate isomerase B
VDYPDFAVAVARGVHDGRFDRGVLVCGSGVGMAITANKVPGIRAAAIADEETARLSREHNDLNVLTLGARMLAPDRAEEILKIFLTTPFQGGRHEGRVAKIHDAEKSAS